MVIIIFLVAWLITGNFLLALILLLLFWCIKAILGGVRELGVMNTLVVLISFSWLFGDDD